MSKDYLHSVCNEFNVPIEDFELQHCARCFQQECTRSQFGKSQFEARVANWEDRLFNKVPQMSEDDPRFVTFQSKKFVSVDAAPAPEVGRSAWVDPRDLTDEAPAEYEVPETKHLEEQEPEVDEPAPEPQISDRTPVTSTTPMNTPNKPGQMIGGRDKPPKAVPAADPWALKKPATDDGVQVVKPGTRIRFGGSGV